MVVLKTQSEWGHAPPPQTPYSIISNLPGWDMLKGVRDGDMSPLARVVHIYPRLSPTHFARTLAGGVAQAVGHEGKGCMIYLDPIMWKYTAGHVSHALRKDALISPDKLTFKVVDVGGHRLYAVLFEPQYTKSLMLSWGTPGIGISIRGAEQLVEKMDTMVEVPFENQDSPPAPTWTPEGPAHEALKERIVGFLRHGAIDLDKVKCQTKDVFLYPTGMAAVFCAKNLLQEYRPGLVNVELGIVFHNTHELLHEESPGGWKHVPKVDKEAIDGLEEWLEKQKSEGGGATFVIVEFPGNPTLDTPDLPRLMKLSEKYGFVFIVDDTLGSFSNVDVLAQCDMLLTSLTKSFSGKSDVLGGSIVLNPLSPHYAQLSKRFTESHRNQLFAVDAGVLLSNSDDYYERSVRLNANGKAIADFLHKSIGQPDSPVVNVQYPSLLPSKPNYDAFMRRSTPEVPSPGYGCLLTVEFDSVETTKAFYERCGFYPSPHLGGHVTIMLAYNMFMFGKDKDEAAALRPCGIKEESIRISAGLEDAKDLLDTLQDALDAAIEVKKARKEN
ncbi:cystathionine beta-lyase/cystathionine gamma-synthase [Pochonia chlamydosporia 170]|uniref:Cystathionine beta-lyase/cystathionine gamma-synthase n=1 Tax=Pochonia chlamydosporia 170 TaxID=1380566 RepID=A0A179FZL8_METCM|nr:cystathionine beta-lyase/cystathionine gamma-synthase [Pochonia chlamydosporia 170]OAQ70668.1 cystathionine beta-lyase/cystathionine gamma-synthase [Pochonia chlamydosporia 170]